MASKLFQFKIFSFLWASATLFHIISYEYWLLPDALYLLETIIAILIIFFPGSVWLFFLLVVSQMIEALYSLPKIHNHWSAVIVADVGFITYASRQLIRRQKIDISDFLRDCVKPLLALTLLVIYFWPTVHKLNLDYFDLSVSCGSYFYTYQLKQLPILSHLPHGQLVFTLGGVLIEASLFFAFLLPKLRIFAITLGLLFHTIIAINPISDFYNFGALMVCLYFAFCPKEFWDYLKVTREKTGHLFSIGRILYGIFFTLLFARNLVYLDDLSLSYFGFFAWLFFQLLVISCWLFFLFHSYKKKIQFSHFKLASAVKKRRMPLACFVLLFLFGLTPYIGLQTASSLSMYSNLRTEGKRNNHFFMPSLKIFKYQEPLVEPYTHKKNLLNPTHSAKTYLPLYEVIRRNESGEGNFVGYKLDRRPVLFSELESLPRRNLFERKFLNFRRVNKEKRLCWR